MPHNKMSNCSIILLNGTIIIYTLLTIYVHGNEQMPIQSRANGTQNIGQVQASSSASSVGQHNVDDDLGDEFWDKLSPITDLPKIDGVKFDKNHIIYADQTEHGENKCIEKELGVKKDELKRGHAQLNHQPQLYTATEKAAATFVMDDVIALPMKKLKSTKTKKSEIWEHFKQINELNKCNYCSKELKVSQGSSTSYLWRHLEREHNKQFASTNYAKKSKKQKISTKF